MATTEELFISISPQTYRAGKSAILIGQTQTLHSLKCLQNLHVLSRQKNDLKKILHKLVSSLSVDIESIREKMPTPKVPKAISKHHEPKITIEEETFHGRDRIEEELQLIQKKLRNLNS